jgi:hypothetical protein
LIHEGGRRVQRGKIDAAAAAVILQDYLDAGRPQGGTEVGHLSSETSEQSPAQRSQVQKSN